MRLDSWQASPPPYNKELQSNLGQPSKRPTLCGWASVFVLSSVLLLGLARPAQAQTSCSATNTAITGITAVTIDTNTDTTGLVDDCTTLLGLKDALVGTEPVVLNPDWAVGTAMDTWEGITVGGTPPRVARLYLIAKNLAGEIPPALGTLMGLTRLGLQGNQLTGEIPQALGSLTNLQELSLGENQLTGGIPPALGTLMGLTQLGLQGNQLTGEIPQALGTLTNLQELSLGGNQLTGGIPQALGTLTNLTLLNLYNNQLTGGIPDLRELTSLRQVDLSDNQLTGEISNSQHYPASLRQLHLYNNQFTGGIPDLRGLTSLSQLYLNGNQLSGDIPDTLATLENLIVLDLHNNQLSGPIPDFSGTKLQWLFLYDNQLSGDIPALSDLPDLQYLFLHNNQLSGDIPNLSDFPNLLRLALHNNQLSGDIPAFSDLPSLQWLVLSDNQLDGDIPAFSDLPSLQRLYLSNNQLSGEVPALSDLPSSLSYLHLSNNQLTGAIPDLSFLTSLQELHLSDNQLSGDIPDLSSLTSLTLLNLSNNQLRGTLPDTLEQLTNLQYLYLHNNQLSGPISPDFGDSSKFPLLEKFYLYATDWTGSIPQALANRAGLELLTNRRPRPPVYLDSVTIEPGGEFSYTIEPFSDPEGEPLTYHATQRDGRALPGWLRFEAASRTFGGRVPGAAGDVEVTVTATDEDRPPAPPTAATPFCDPARGFDEDGTVVAGEANPPPLCATASFLIRVTAEHDRPTAIRLDPGDRSLTVRWMPPSAPASATLTGYAVRYRPLGSGGWTEVSDLPTDPLSHTLRNLTNGQSYEVQVRADPGEWAASRTGTPGTSPPPPPPPPPGPRPPGGGPPSGGGRGPACAADRHGNTAASATALAFSAATASAICPAADVDYFTVTAPSRGLVFVETTGSVNLRGTLWQNGEVLESGPTGRQTDARLGALVEAGAVIVAVQGQGGATGEYALVVTFSPGYLENPGHNSFQSGIGVISGWVCAAEKVEIEIETERGETERYEAGYGTERLDTAALPDGTPLCGDTDNGFGLLFNWNRLGAGEHTVVAWVDGVELGRAVVTVTTVGAGAEEEFLRGAEGECVVEDFPLLGETVRLEWQQNKQNFVITSGARPAGENRAGIAGMGYLENPGPNSFQSGIGVISGWVCEAEKVEIEIETERGETERQVAAYGTERLDTAARRKDGTPLCGDTDNGFGLLFNWNRLGAGEHTVVALVDGVALGWATVRVTTVGEGAEEEFLRDVAGECVVADFPMLGETVTLAVAAEQSELCDYGRGVGATHASPPPGSSACASPPPRRVPQQAPGQGGDGGAPAWEGGHPGRHAGWKPALLKEERDARPGRRASARPGVVGAGGRGLARPAGHGRPGPNSCAPSGTSTPAKSRHRRLYAL